MLIVVEGSNLTTVETYFQNFDSVRNAGTREALTHIVSMCVAVQRYMWRIRVKGHIGLQVARMPLKLVAVVTTVLCQKFGKPIKFYRLVCSRIPKKKFKNITSHFCNVTICSLAAPWFKIPPSTWITIARSKWTTDSFFPFRVMGRASPGRPNVTSGAWLGCMKRLKISKILSPRYI